MAEHGTRTNYVRGCRCEKCKAANTAYGIALKERKRTGGNVATVTALRSVPNQEPELRGPGRVETQVMAEINSLSSRAKLPGVVESALAMARILDNPRVITTHPSAQRQLMVALEKLHSASTRKDSNLASVAQLSVRTAPVKEPEQSESSE